MQAVHTTTRRSNEPPKPHLNTKLSHPILHLLDFRGLDLDQWGVEDSFEIGLIKMAILDHLGRLDPMNDLIWKHGHCFLSCSLWDDQQWKLSSNTQSKQEDHELQQLLIHHIHYTNKTLERSKEFRLFEFLNICVVENPTKASSVDVEQLIRSLLFTQGLGQLKELIIKAIASTGNRNQKVRKIGPFFSTFCVSIECTT